MIKRWLLVSSILLLVSLLMVGCGISHEEHNAVLAERDSVQTQVASLQRQLKEKNIEISRLEQQIRDLQGQSVADEPAPAISDGVIKIEAVDLYLVTV